MWRKIIDFLRSKSYHASFKFVWTLLSSVLVVFNNFLLIDATDKSKISSDQKRFFIAFSQYPFSFFANTPFKHSNTLSLFTSERISVYKS